MAFQATRHIGPLSSMVFLASRKLQFIYPSFIHQRTDEEDNSPLDTFTSKLVQNKSSKWIRRKALAQSHAAKTSTTDSFSMKNSLNTIQHMDIESINGLFQQAIDYDDWKGLIELTKQCVECDKVPSLAVLLNSVPLCSYNGDKDTIIWIAQLCEKIQPEFLEENSNFEHYIAEAIWVKGNIAKSLKTFEKVYKENVYLRRRIRNILEHLILSSIANHSEASLVSLINFSEMLIRDHNDYFTLGCLWQACILSKWFSDQQIALGFLDKYPGLCRVIENKVSYIVKAALQQHDTEMVYRLIEVLLRLKMDSEVYQAILSLIDYWIQQGDLRQCREIIYWSLQNNVKLPAVYNNEKLVKMFSKDAVDIRLKLSQQEKKKMLPITEYKF
ncbi:uncharacterized protein [Euwallacea fornicatus]|uniref:uncharacterized protein n=1 Tax=Euwallacea fornicatus TaxID=995702 RepID=UPI0033904790